MTMHPSVERVNEVVAGKGFAGRVVVLPDAAPTARAAAELLGVEVGAIANSLIFRTESGAPLLVMTSGAHRVDTDKVAALIGEPIGRADAAFVRTHTGQVIGGVAPVGHPRPIRTLIDTELRGYPEIWSGGGIPHGMLPMSFEELIVLTGGEVAEVA
ncbi:prolyl-tRNA editing enzyme YbaK/EbsC (Cys-tRNA(Pro) deacylase) [Propionibacteriaceae bacterium ES.041]|uniref:YbaK/EbsC family protein n=1 Tax=Enemella evansiae TaxID=2016499 RepID=UPI000C017268|nr:YbaK/EbsC family protein [Enemella evansiae]PFG68854.1 prolyl-tRNA editing enzyme YbaK/EbsC (Cys-tRNA(Pro) deacylase) [Propionibacteriaceae bacterium ES.041]TDO89783.1 prolyl-tRNA editing enzyme YbaK/EbsC (Cys-tRNA(Pro) deacylase) [Enemella evansiae]